jgi:hypothetical protein
MNVPLPFNEQFQWLVAFQNCVCSGWREQFSGEDKAQHAQGRCRGVGWDMPRVDARVGARVQPVGEERTMKLMVTKREKKRDDKKKKKLSKTTSRSDKEKKSKKKHFGLRETRPHGLPKRVLRLSFGPQVPPDSGFTSKL